MFGHEDAFSRSNGVLHLNVRRFIFVANFPGGVNLWKMVTNKVNKHWYQTRNVRCDLVWYDHMIILCINEKSTLIILEKWISK